MIQKLIFFITIIALSSCGAGDDVESQKEVNTLTDTAKVIATAELNGCYTMYIGKDTARLKLDINSVFVKGSLSYKRYEKDSNEGTIEGTVQHDLIKTWYRFGSEGVISVREVYFKIIGDKLAEGYGDVDMRNDTAYFKFPTALRYEEKHLYTKTACDSTQL